MLIERLEFEECNDFVDGYFTSEEFKQKWDSVIPRLDDNVKPIWIKRNPGEFYIDRETQMIFIMAYKSTPTYLGRNVVIAIHHKKWVILMSETKSLTDHVLDIKYISNDLKGSIDIIKKHITAFFGWLNVNYSLKN